MSGYLKASRAEQQAATERMAEELRALTHSQHTQPVRGCLACEDALAEARALQAEAPWNER